MVLVKQQQLLLLLDVLSSLETENWKRMSSGNSKHHRAPAFLWFWQSDTTVKTWLVGWLGFNGTFNTE